MTANIIKVSTHSRLKAAGDILMGINAKLAVSTHSRLKAAGKSDGSVSAEYEFQHTAA